MRGELLGVMVSRQNPQLADMPWISRPISVRDCAAIVSILAAAQLTAQARSTANPAANSPGHSPAAGAS